MLALYTLPTHIPNYTLVSKLEKRLVKCFELDGVSVIGTDCFVGESSNYFYLPEDERAIFIASKILPFYHGKTSSTLTSRAPLNMENPFILTWATSSSPNLRGLRSVNI